jgi:general secretion pathway protein H
MVVLVLIGIIFTFAVLSFGGDDLAEALERETRQLVTLINLATDEAVLRGDELAIRFTENSYTFLMLHANGWHEPEGDRLLKTYTLPKGMRLRIEVEGELPDLGKTEEEDDNASPQVFILSSGEMTPFEASFTVEQSHYRYHLAVSPLGEQEWQAEEVF